MMPPRTWDSNIDETPAWKEWQLAKQRALQASWEKPDKKAYWEAKLAEVEASLDWKIDEQNRALKKLSDELAWHQEKYLDLNERTILMVRSINVLLYELESAQERLKANCSSKLSDQGAD